ncbi:MAG: response regulator transcription factor [Desulfobacula sp.]|nr:response regulator transcription factor [Desulfobacula sp.]
MEHIRILIVDDDARFRQTLGKMVADNPDLEVIGEAENGEQAIRLAGNLNPDVVLMDIRMPGTSGLTATRLLTREMPDLRVIMISIFDEDEYRKAAFNAGAVSYIEKKSINGELIPAIKEVCTNCNMTKKDEPPETANRGS